MLCSGIVVVGPLVVDVGTVAEVVCRGGCGSQSCCCIIRCCGVRHTCGAASDVVDVGARAEDVGKVVVAAKLLLMHQ